MRRRDAELSSRVQNHAVMKTVRDVLSSDRSTRSATIVVVEDEVLVRMVAADYLRYRGFRVVEAGTADEAIRVLGAGERVDVVFSDVQTPGSPDGFALARRIRREQPGVKVILTSGAPRPAAVACELFETGPVMRKPYELGEVARRTGQFVARTS